MKSPTKIKCARSYSTSGTKRTLSTSAFF